MQSFFKQIQLRLDFGRSFNQNVKQLGQLLSEMTEMIEAVDCIAPPFCLPFPDGSLK